MRTISGHRAWFCHTISAVDKNLRAKASSKNPRTTFTVLSQPPDLGKALSQPEVKAALAKDAAPAARLFGAGSDSLAGNPVAFPDRTDPRSGTPNITADNMFNSPDGMMFDSTGLLWIQTDGEDSNEGDFVGQGNNQMLAGDPATGRITGARFVLSLPVGTPT